MELITDNVHILPALVRFTFNTFGDDRVCLIADSAMSCGLPDGQYSLGGQAITVKGPRATLTEHPDTIAGSNTCLYDCMKRAVLEMNVPLESAVRAASENPAKSIGVDADYGSLAAGRYGTWHCAIIKLVPGSSRRVRCRGWEERIGARCAWFCGHGAPVAAVRLDG